MDWFSWQSPCRADGVRIYSNINVAQGENEVDENIEEKQPGS